jgi:hypothetical protein
MLGYPIRRLPVPVPETTDHGAGTGREMRARVRVRIVNFHVLTRPRVFAQRLPYSAQYVDGVVGTLKGTHNLYQQKALARWIQLTLILTQKKSAVPPWVRIKYGGYGYPYKLGLYNGSGRVRKSLPVHDSGLDLPVHPCLFRFQDSSAGRHEIASAGPTNREIGFPAYCSTRS